MADGMLSRIRNGIAEYIETEDRSYSDEAIARMAIGLRSSEIIVSAAWSASRMAALTMLRGNIELEGLTAEYWRPALSNDFLFQACFDVFLNGNSVYYLGNGGTGSLRRVSRYEVRGKEPPFYYLVTLPAPDGEQEKDATAAEILHLRIGTNANSPWNGRGIFADSILAGIDLGFKIGSRFPTQRFMPFPVDKQSNVNINDQEKQTASRGKAEIQSIARQSGVYNIPNSSNRKAEKIEVTEMNFSPNQNAVALREMLVAEVWDSIGYPRALRAEQAPGQAARQEYGRWVDTVLQPICDILSEQLAGALECDVTWDLSPARVPLVTDQAVAFHQFVRDGKLTPESAADLVGFNPDLLDFIEQTEEPAQEAL